MRLEAEVIVNMSAFNIENSASEDRNSCRICPLIQTISNIGTVRFIYIHYTWSEGLIFGSHSTEE